MYVEQRVCLYAYTYLCVYHYLLAMQVVSYLGGRRPIFLKMKLLAAHYTGRWTSRRMR